MTRSRLHLRCSAPLYGPDLDKLAGGAAHETPLPPNAGPPPPPPCCALCEPATAHTTGSHGGPGSADNSPLPNSPLPQKPISNSDSLPAASAHSACALRWNAPAAPSRSTTPIFPHSRSAQCPQLPARWSPIKLLRSLGASPTTASPA